MLHTKKKHLVITDAKASDFASIQAIYAHYVEKTSVTLEEIPPSQDEMKRRWLSYVEMSYPYIVAIIDDEVVGYAYATQYKPRTAYRFAVEESVYVAKEYMGCGIGKSLLLELIRRCRENGYRQMLAVIAVTEDEASIKFHRKLEFRMIGKLEAVGFKFNTWIDTVLMQIAL